jgi:hypothetical protein
MLHWMKRFVGRRTRELPLAKRDLLNHPHVDMLPTRWTERSVSTALEWSNARVAASGRDLGSASEFRG